MWNDRGTCLAGAVVSAGIRPGVVQLATGAWYDPLEPGRIGTLDVHGNPNVLTRDLGSSKLAQGPTAHTALVELERFEGEIPEIKVFTPPPRGVSGLTTPPSDQPGRTPVASPSWWGMNHCTSMSTRPAASM